MNLLIADDHKQITSILSDYAKKEGYTVMIANDGKEALSLFSRNTFDLVLLDVMMPEMDGFQVCRDQENIFCPHHNGHRQRRGL